MRTKTPHRTWPRNVALIIPLILVNAAAVYGQAGWAYEKLGHSLPLSVLIAGAVESVGIYLAAEAHAAAMAGHSSGALRLGSYAVGLLSGALNFAHFAGPHYRPTPLAVTFGILSSISPWLWAIRSRAMNRDRLFALGLIDPRAVKFARLRWLLFPNRTMHAFRLAVWEGVQSPTEAIRLADSARSAKRALNRPAVVPITLPLPIERGDADPDDEDPEPEPEPKRVTRRRSLAAAPRPLSLVAAPVAPVAPRRTATRSQNATRDSATRDAVIERHKADRSRPARDIATELGISKRTAERHIASVRNDTPNPEEEGIS